MTGLIEGVKLRKWKVEKRAEANWALTILAAAIAFLAAFLVSAILIRVAGADVGEAFVALFGGAFGSRRATLETLVRSIPLILTGLSASLAFRGKVWNIGAEGQLYAGAMAGYWAFTLLEGVPRALLLIGILVFSFLGGAFWAGIAGFIKVRFNVDEIISTVMLNYVITFLLSFMLSGVGPWREPESFYQHTAKLPEVAHLPVLISNSRMNIAFLIAIVAAAAVYLLLQRTPLGYEIRALGFNPRASKFKGTNINRLVVIIMVLSGGIAGLAGASELFGIHHRLKLAISEGLGYSGIIVAMLAALDPLGVIVAAILFGALYNGSFRLQIVTQVPSAFISVIQALVLIFMLSAAVLARYRIRRIEHID